MGAFGGWWLIHQLNKGDLATQRGEAPSSPAAGHSSAIGGFVIIGLTALLLGCLAGYVASR